MLKIQLRFKTVDIIVLFWDYPRIIFIAKFLFLYHCETLSFNSRPKKSLFIHFWKVKAFAKSFLYVLKVHISVKIQIRLNFMVFSLKFRLKIRRHYRKRRNHGREGIGRHVGTYKVSSMLARATWSTSMSTVFETILSRVHCSSPKYKWEMSILSNKGNSRV